MVRFARVGLALVFFAAPQLFADWPQWRGPNRDGKSTERELLEQWPAGGPPLEWRAEGLGRGFSSVSTSGSRLFTMGDLGERQYAFAIDRRDGTVTWRTDVGPSWADHDLYPGSRSTPTADGEHLYVLGTEGTLLCLRQDTGEIVWSRSLVMEFDGFMMMARAGVNWRYTESPLIDGQRVVVTPGSPRAALVALDKTTGAEIWRAAVPPLGDRGDDGAGYASVVVSHAAGVKQYVQLLGRGLVGIRAEDGALLWGYNGIANDVANIATPIVHGDYVFGSTGYQTGAVLLKLQADGTGGVSAEEVYFLEPDRFQNHHGGILLHDGYLYTGTGHNRGFPLAVRLETGEPAWGPVRNDGRNSAAVAYADEKLYFRYQNGLMLLIDANPESYRECGSFVIPDVAAPSWAHPVIDDGRLYLREQDKLYSYDVRAR